MPRFKYTLLILFVAAQVHAQSSELRKRPYLYRLHMGLAYQEWSERLLLSQSSTQETGMAVYAGPGILFGVERLQGAWLLGSSLVVAFGKASSGGYSQLTFADGTERNWYGGQGNLYSMYRLNNYFEFGGGALVRYRQVDWEPADQTVLVQVPAAMSIAGQVQFRWRILSRYLFSQELSFHGAQDTQWLLSASKTF